MSTPRAHLLRSLLQLPSEPVREGVRTKHITREEWISPQVRELVHDADRQTKRMLLSVYTSNHFTFDNSVQHDLTRKLQGWGYSVPDLRNLLPTRTERIQAVNELRDRNVLEADAEFERLLEITGSTATEVVGFIEGGFDEYHVHQEPMLWTGTDAEGRTIHGFNLYDKKSTDLWGGFPAKADHALHTVGVGCRGGADRLRAMLLKVDTEVKPSFDEREVAAAIDLAAKKGIRVINMSLLAKGDQGPSVILDAVRRHHPRLVFVKSAGNSGKELGVDEELLPEVCVSAHDSPNFLVIASALPDGTKDPNSDYSAVYATHATRGNTINSFGPNDGFALGSGTSCAAPDVANLVAKMFVLDPDLDASTVRTLLDLATTRSGAWQEQVASGGLINRRTALRLAAASALLRRGQTPAQVAKALDLKNSAVAKEIVARASLMLQGLESAPA